MNSKTEKKEKIKNAVLAVVSDEGIRNLSTSKIAEKLEMSQGSIFRHFQSVQDIIYAIIEDVQANLINELREISLSSKLPRKRLQMFICKTVSYFVENKGIITIIISESFQKNYPLIREQIQQIFRCQKQLLSKILHDGIADGTWDDSVSVEYLAMLCFGIPYSINCELSFNSNEFKPVNFCENMTKFVLKILSNNVVKHSQDE